MKLVTGGLFAIASSVGFAAAATSARDQGVYLAIGCVFGAFAAILTVWGLVEEVRKPGRS